MLCDKYFDILKSFQDKRKNLNTLSLKHFKMAVPTKNTLKIKLKSIKSRFFNVMLIFDVQLNFFFENVQCLNSLVFI